MTAKLANLSTSTCTHEFYILFICWYISVYANPQIFYSSSALHQLYSLHLVKRLVSTHSVQYSLYPEVYSEYFIGSTLYIAQ